MKWGDLRGALKDKLSRNELKRVPRSFDIIGSREKAVAIIEIPNDLTLYEGVISEALTRVHKNVKSVLKKVSEREGTYRTREFKLIFGDEKTEVLHKEHGCAFKLDPQRVYFSPREGTERLRIAQQVKPNEIVLVMFSGIGPLPIIIAKKQPAVRKIYAVELNPVAHHYCVENIHLNRLRDKISPILGDAKEVCPKFKERFDRVLMPLPKGAYKFLEVAIPCVKDRGVLHFYHWAHERDLFSEAIKLVKNAVKELGRETEILDTVKVLPYGPRVWKVRVDVKL